MNVQAKSRAPKERKMKHFSELGLSETLNTSLAHMKYDVPTPIQAQAIPHALEGHDILGSAQTGTGKTAAFSIPTVEHLLKHERSAAIVLTPTRELGKQVMEIFRQLLGPKSPVKTAFLIGGESMQKQTQQLKRRPRLIVGTPGRINDHLKRKNLHLDKTDFLVLDEMDRMLDMGFSIQIDEIVKFLPAERQTLMFSATMPANIIKMSDKYLTEPKRVSVGSTFNPSKDIKQSIIRVKDATEKYEELTRELEIRGGSVIIFVKTKHGADKLAKKLRGDEHSAEAIHGDLKQSKRERVIREYRAKQFRVLVATDVVARGLDVPHVAHVINFDLPQVPEDYIHRIGRTARAGKTGEALCLISPQDGRKWFEIECLMDPEKKKERSEERKGGRKKPLARNRGRSSDNAGRGRKSEDRPRDTERRERPSKGKSFKDSKRDERPAKKPRRFDRDGDAPRSSEARPPRRERPQRESFGEKSEGRRERPVRDRNDAPSRSDRPQRDNAQRSEKPSRSKAWKEKQGDENRPKRARPIKERSTRDESRGDRAEKPFKKKPRSGGDALSADAPLKRKKPKSTRINKNKGKPKPKVKKA